MINYLERHENKQREKDGLPPITASDNNPWSKSDSQSGFTPASQLGAGSGGAVGSATGLAASSQPVGAGQILLILLRLRQCCSHLSLMKNVSYFFSIFN